MALVAQNHAYRSCQRQLGSSCLECGRLNSGSMINDEARSHSHFASGGNNHDSGTRTIARTSTNPGTAMPNAQWPNTAIGRIRANEIGRAHVWTTVTKAHLVCRILLETNKTSKKNN